MYNAYNANNISGAHDNSTAHTSVDELCRSNNVVHNFHPNSHTSHCTHILGASDDNLVDHFRMVHDYQRSDDHGSQRS